MVIPAAILATSSARRNAIVRLPDAAGFTDVLFHCFVKGAGAERSGMNITREAFLCG